MGQWGRPASCARGECPKCLHRVYMRQWYASKTFEERQAMRQGRDKERERERERKRYHNQRKLDPEYRRQKRAVTLANRAILAGELAREPCEVCGAPEVEGHHDDYSLPLGVRWLCSEHHAEFHTSAQAA